MLGSKEARGQVEGPLYEVSVRTREGGRIEKYLEDSPSDHQMLQSIVGSR